MSRPAIPHYGLAQIDFLQTWLTGIAQEAAARARSEPARAADPPDGRRPPLAGPGPAWRRCPAARAAATRRITALWDDFDVLLTPGTATTAIAAEGGFGRSAPRAVNIAGRFTPFTAMFNLTGQPAITVPAGIGGDGLPLSVQLVGRMGAEDVLYSLAGQLEAAAPWAQRRPALARG